MNTVVMSLWLDLAVAVIALLVAALALFSRRRGERGPMGMPGPCGPPGITGAPGAMGRSGVGMSQTELVHWLAHNYGLTPITGPARAHETAFADVPRETLRYMKDRCPRCHMPRTPGYEACANLECGHVF